MKTEFFLPIIPPTVTHQEHQVTVIKGKPHFYEPDELKAARAKLEAHLAQHVPEKMYTGALRVIVKWLFPITGNHKDGEWKTTKGDLDNLAKMLLDVMTHLGYWQDDALITSMILEKFWASTPGIYVKIESLDPNEGENHV
jgi:Holliday junction resolvase RusA-like endonuclease